MMPPSGSKPNFYFKTLNSCKLFDQKYLKAPKQLYQKLKFKLVFSENKIQCPKNEMPKSRREKSKTQKQKQMKRKITVDLCATLYTRL